MAKRLKFGNVVVCEHVVSGPSNKNTLINTYSGDIVVSEMPARLTFGFYFELMEVQNVGDLLIEISLGKKKPFQLGGKIDSSSENAVLAVPLIPFEIQEDTVLNVHFAAEGYARTRALKKRIYRGEVPGLIRPNA